MDYELIKHLVPYVTMLGMVLLCWYMKNKPKEVGSREWVLTKDQDKVVLYEKRLPLWVIVLGPVVMLLLCGLIGSIVAADARANTSGDHIVTIALGLYVPTLLLSAFFWFVPAFLFNTSMELLHRPARINYNFWRDCYAFWLLSLAAIGGLLLL